MTSVRLRRASALTVSAVLLLGACGGSAGDDADVVSVVSDDAVSVLAATADTTTAAQSARFAATVEMGTGEAAMRFGIDGLLALDGDRALFRMDLGQLGLPGATGAVEARLVDGVLYMDIGAIGGLAGSAFGGRRWLALDLASMAESLGIDAPLGGGDPAQILRVLESLRGVSGDIEEIGTDEVRGTETTHYRVVVDLDRALAEVPEALRDLADSAFEMLGDGTLPMDVWVDAEGRLRRMRYDADLGALADGTGLGGSMSVLMDLYDFGVEVDVEAPAAAETLDMSEVFGGFPTGSSA